MVYPRRPNKSSHRLLRVSPGIRRMNSRARLLTNSFQLQSAREAPREGHSEANSTLMPQRLNRTYPELIRDASYENVINPYIVRPNLTLPPHRLNVSHPNRSRNRSSHSHRTSKRHSARPSRKISSVFSTDEVHIDDNFVTINRTIRLPIKPGYKFQSPIANSPSSSFDRRRAPSIHDYTQPGLTESSSNWGVSMPRANESDARYHRFSTLKQQDDRLSAERQSNMIENSASPSPHLNFDDRQSMLGARTRPSFRSDRSISANRSARLNSSNFSPALQTALRRASSNLSMSSQAAPSISHASSSQSLSPRTARPIRRTSSNFSIPPQTAPYISRASSDQSMSPRTTRSMSRTRSIASRTTPILSRSSSEMSLRTAPMLSRSSSATSLRTARPMRRASSHISMTSQTAPISSTTSSSDMPVINRRVSSMGSNLPTSEKQTTGNSIQLADTGYKTRSISTEKKGTAEKMAAAKAKTVESQPTSTHNKSIDNATQGPSDRPRANYECCYGMADPNGELETQASNSNPPSTTPSLTNVPLMEVKNSFDLTKDKSKPVYDHAKAVRLVSKLDKTNAAININLLVKSNKPALDMELLEVSMDHKTVWKKT